MSYFGLIEENMELSHIDFAIFPLIRPVGIINFHGLQIQVLLEKAKQNNTATEKDLITLNKAIEKTNI